MIKQLGAWLCFAGAIAGIASAQQPPASPPIKAGSEEVVVDAIVRDKKNHTVTDLKADDFSVYDNGNKMPVKTFRLVQGEQTGGAAVQMQLDPLRQIRLVSLVFDHLDINSRRLARDAALDLLKQELPQNVYLAVLTIDHKLEALQQFTNDRDALRKAIERATGSENADFSTDTTRIERQLTELVGTNGGGTNTLEERVQNLQNSSSAAPAPGTTPDSSALVNAKMAQMMLDTLRTQQSMAMAEQGRAQIFGLLDAVKEQYQLPGRKTLVFFSTGLATPQGTERALEDLKNTASRNNVSIYCIDAGGLGTARTNQGAMDALNGAVKNSARNTTNPNDAVTFDQANAMNTAINSTRGNVQENLQSLADSTGGFLIANTNDFRNPLRRLAEDIETYYEITYDPQITNYDGSVHKIAVKTDQKDLHVFARNQYIALPPALMKAGGVVSAYEVPLLKAIDEPQPPRTFQFHATGLHYRGAQSQPVCDLVVDIPLTDLTFQENKTKNIFEGRFSYVALVKNAQGEVVKKMQRDMPLTIAPDKMDALKQSHFIATEHFDLPPGRYLLETAVLDQQGNKISVRKTSVFMPPPSTSIGISSVTVVRSVKQKDNDTAPTDPLLMADRLITPTLAADVKKTPNQAALPLYVVIYPDKNNPEKPQLIMEFSKDGQVLGNGTPQLGDPDAQGKIQYIADAPLAKLDPGNYQIRFIAKQGTEAAQESVSFTIE